MMKKYIGTKQLMATPMTFGAHNKYRGWKQPENEDLDALGYLVEYQDGGKPNDERHDGYISWSPADVFEKTYRIAETPFDRLCIEYDELMEKINKLTLFLGREDKDVIAGELQCELMELQRVHMKSYLLVLRSRIDSIRK